MAFSGRGRICDRVQAVNTNSRGAVIASGKALTLRGERSGPRAVFAMQSPRFSLFQF
jgi:hypothetical protein